MGIWHSLFFQPLVNILMFLYQALGNNMGVAIVVATVLIRLALIPLTNPGMKSAQKMQELKPQLDKLKEKHKADKQALAQAQLELYRQHGVNPLGSLLPMIIQVVILIALFQAFNSVLIGDHQVEAVNEVLYPLLKLPAQVPLNTQFAYLDISKPDLIPLPFTLNLGLFTLSSIPGIFLLAAAGVQFWSSKLMMGKSRKKPVPKPSDKAAEPDQMEMMQQMQSQMMYLMPLMTIVIGYSFASGLVLYWLTFSVVMVIQQLWLERKQKQGVKIEGA